MLLRIGAIGSALTALCCFTPLLVWLLSAVGLSALIAYSDIVLLPLLTLFVVLLIIGVSRHRGKTDTS